MLSRLLHRRPMATAAPIMEEQTHSELRMPLHMAPNQRLRRLMERSLRLQTVPTAPSLSKRIQLSKLPLLSHLPLPHRPLPLRPTISSSHPRHSHLEMLLRHQSQFQPQISLQRRRHRVLVLLHRTITLTLVKVDSLLNQPNPRLKYRCQNRNRPTHLHQLSRRQIRPCYQ